MAKKILHLADLHLGSRHDYLGPDAPSRAAEVDSLLDRIAGWLLGEGRDEVGILLIAGDLFETPWPEEALAEQVVRALRRIEQAGVAVVTVPGNHDEWTYTDGVFRRWAASWPGTLVTAPAPKRVAAIELDSVTVEIVSCAYHQGRNPPSTRWQNPLPERADGSLRIGLFHGTLDRLGGLIAEGERAFPLDFGRLAGWGLDYLALGHIHKVQEYREGSCLAVYPGPIEGKGFDDPGTTDLTLVDVSGGTPAVRRLDARSLGIRSREVATLEIDLVRIADSDALDREILATVDPDRPPPIVRVELRGVADPSCAPQEVQRRLASRFLHLEIMAGEPAAALGDWERLAAQRSLEGVFVRRLLEKRDAAASPEEKRIWDGAAEAGLRALGRGRG